jgi:hypothetical protein
MSNDDLSGLAPSARLGLWFAKELRRRMMIRCQGGDANKKRTPERGAAIAIRLDELWRRELEASGGLSSTTLAAAWRSSKADDEEATRTDVEALSDTRCPKSHAFPRGETSKDRMARCLVCYLLMLLDKKLGRHPRSRDAMARLGGARLGPCWRAGTGRGQGSQQEQVAAPQKGHRFQR